MNLLARLPSPARAIAPAPEPAPLPVFTDRIEDLLDPAFDTLISLDFETYYDRDYTLRKMATSDYVRDPRFETLLVGVKVNDAATVVLDAPTFAAWVRAVDWSRCAVLAHHAHFDGLILAHHYGVKPAMWFCTLSMARPLHGTDVGGSLEELMPFYGVGAKGREIENAVGKHAADFTPEEWARFADYCRNDVDGMKGIFDGMLVEGFPESELLLIDTTIRMFTEPSFVTDEALLNEVLVDERARKAELLERVGLDKKTIGSNEKLAEVFRSFGVEPPRKKSPKAKNPDGTLAMIYAFAKSDPGMQELLEHPDDEVRFLAEARVAIKSSINESRTLRMLEAGAGGRRVPVYLKYAAAHTHRWGGGDKRNFQNFERTNKKDPKKGRIRKALRAPDGHHLVVADSNAIEARMLAWFAGHDELVAGFAENRDVYSAFASRVYRRHVDRKKNPEDEIPGHVGKTAILGLGYQMGWAKFAATLAAGPMGAPPIVFTAQEAEGLGVRVEDYFADPELYPGPNQPGYIKRRRANWRKVEAMPSRLPLPERLVHCAVAAYLVRMYRDTNAPIAELWSEMERVIEAMAEGDEFAFGPGGCVRTVRHGLVMPSGLTLKYPGLERRVEVTIDDEGEEHTRVHYSFLDGHYGKTRKHIYGGLLVENIIQALARCVVAEQALRVRAAGFHIVTTTHDEIVACVPEADAQRCLDATIRIMKTAPSWAAGCPLNAEGGFGRSYGEVK